LGGLADAALNIFKKFILFLFWAPAHAFRVVIGCFAAIHAIGVGFPLRPLAQKVGSGFQPEPTQPMAAAIVSGLSKMQQSVFSRKILFRFFGPGGTGY